MRYIVITEDTPKDHPMFPNERLYKIKDLKTGEKSMGAYKKLSLAEEVCREKNEEELNGC